MVYQEDEEGTMSVECVGFSKGAFRWVASGGMDKTLKVSTALFSPLLAIYCLPIILHLPASQLPYINNLLSLPDNPPLILLSLP